MTAAAGAVSLIVWAFFGFIVTALVLESGDWPWYGVFIVSIAGALVFILASAMSFLVVSVIRDNIRYGEEWWD